MRNEDISSISINILSKKRAEIILRNSKRDDHDYSQSQGMIKRL
jgi:hypothetical protein